MGHPQFSPDGHLLATSHGGEDARMPPGETPVEIRIWDAVSGAVQHVIPMPQRPDLYGLTTYAVPIAFSLEGSLLAVGDGTTVTIVDVRTGQVVGEPIVLLDGQIRPGSTIPAIIDEVTFGAAGAVPLLAVAAYGFHVVDVYDLSVPEAPVLMAQSHAGGDRGIEWDFGEATELPFAGAGTSIAVSRDGLLAIAPYTGGGSVDLYDLVANEHVATLRTGKITDTFYADIVGLNFNADGTRLAVRIGAETTLWDVSEARAIGGPLPTRGVHSRGRPVPARMGQRLARGQQPSDGQRRPARRVEPRPQLVGGEALPRSRAQPHPC